MIVSRKTFWICTWAYAFYHVLFSVTSALAFIPGTFMDSLYPGLSKVLSDLMVALDISVVAFLLSYSILTALLLYLFLTLKFKNYVKEWVFFLYFSTNVSMLAFFVIPLDLFSFSLFLAMDFFVLFTCYRNYPSYMISPPKDDADDKEKEKTYDYQSKPTVSRRIFLSFKILLIVLCAFSIASSASILVFLQTPSYGAGASEFGEIFATTYKEFRILEEIMMILGVSMVALYIFFLFQILINTFIIAVLMLKNIDTRMKEWAFAFIAYDILFYSLNSFFDSQLFSLSFYSIVLLMLIIWYRNYKYYDYGRLDTAKVLTK